MQVGPDATLEGGGLNVQGKVLTLGVAGELVALWPVATDRPLLDRQSLRSSTKLVLLLLLLLGEEGEGEGGEEEELVEVMEEAAAAAAAAAAALCILYSSSVFSLNFCRK